MIEIVTFRLRSDADPDVFKALDERLQTEFFYHQSGLERRTTAIADDGSHVCISHWSSAEDADVAAAKASTDHTTELTALVDAASIRIHRYHTL